MCGWGSRVCVAGLVLLGGDRLSCSVVWSSVPPLLSTTWETFARSAACSARGRL